MCIDSVYSVQTWHLAIVRVPACAHGHIQPYQPCVHAFSIFPLFPYLVHFFLVHSSKMNQPICHHRCLLISNISASCLSGCVISFHYLSCQTQHPLAFIQLPVFFNVQHLFASHEWLSAAAPKSDMSDHKFKSQECKFVRSKCLGKKIFIWGVDSWRKIKSGSFQML